jgi:hypothetical protein
MITVDTTLAAGTWVGDPVHSDVSFKVRHMGVGKVRGTFALASAALTVGDDGGGRVTALIDPVSVDTGNRQRDQHITSADFLDVENHPQIEFTSTEVRDFDGETFILVGELTLHGVTRTVELEASASSTTRPARSAPGSRRPPPSAVPRSASTSNSASAPATSWSPTPSRSPSRSSSRAPDRTRDDPRRTPSYVPKGLET